MGQEDVGIGVEMLGCYGAELWNRDGGWDVEQRHGAGMTCWDVGSDVGHKDVRLGCWAEVAGLGRGAGISDRDVGLGSGAGVWGRDVG